MKFIISERQYKLLTEDEERKILRVPGLEVFGGWEYLQKYLEKLGNPLYSIDDDLDLNHTDIENLGNLVYVGGYLYLIESTINNLGNLKKVRSNLYLYKTPIKSLGNPESVGGSLDLSRSDIENLGNLQYVGGDLNLRYTPLSYMHTKKEIKEMVKVGGDIYM